MESNNNATKRTKTPLQTKDTLTDALIEENLVKTIFDLVVKLENPTTHCFVNLHHIKLTCKNFRFLAEKWYPFEEYYPKQDVWNRIVMDHNSHYAACLLKQSEAQSFDAANFENALKIFSNTLDDTALCLVKVMIGFSDFWEKQGEDYFAEQVIRFQHVTELYSLLLNYADIEYNNYKILRTAISNRDMKLFFSAMARGTHKNFASARLISAATKSSTRIFSDYLFEVIQPDKEFKRLAEQDELEECYAIFKRWVPNNNPRSAEYNLAAKFLEVIESNLVNIYNEKIAFCTNKFKIWKGMIEHREIVIHAKLFKEVLQSRKKDFIAHVLATSNKKLDDDLIDNLIKLNDSNLAELMADYSYSFTTMNQNILKLISWRDKAIKLHCFEVSNVLAHKIQMIEDSQKKKMSLKKMSKKKIQ